MTDYFKIGFDAGEHAGAFLLAEKIRVLIYAIRHAPNNGAPDDYILLSVMEDVIKSHLPEDKA